MRYEKFSGEIITITWKQAGWLSMLEIGDKILQNVSIRESLKVFVSSPGRRVTVYVLGNEIFAVERDDGKLFSRPVENATATGLWGLVLVPVGIGILILAYHYLFQKKLIQEHKELLAQHSNHQILD